MTSFVTIKGYAAPFAQAEKYAGRLEYFDHGAFNAMLAKPHDVFLNFADHDGSALCRQLTLFADDYGLGFIASMRAEIWKSIKCYVVRDHWFASVNTVSEKTEMRKIAGGEVAACIHAATIDHITITNRPIYQGTGVWPGEIVGEYPPRIRRLAAKWEAGRACWLQKKRSANKHLADAAQASLVKASFPIGRTIGGHFVMCSPNGLLWQMKCGATR